MVERPVPVAQRQPLTDRILDVRLRRLRGVDQRSSVGKPRGDRRRERAPGAVGVRALKARTWELVKRLAVVEDVDDLTAR